MPRLFYYFPGVVADAVAVNQFGHPAKFFIGDGTVKKLMKGCGFIFICLFCNEPVVEYDQQVFAKHFHGVLFYQPPVPFCAGQPQFFPPFPLPE